MKLALPMDRSTTVARLLGASGPGPAGWSKPGERPRGSTISAGRHSDTILGGVADAFSLEKEDPATVRRYDTAPLVRPEQISRRWNNYKRYVDNATSLGKLMLLGPPAVRTGLRVRDSHHQLCLGHACRPDNAGVEEGMGYMGVPFDHAIATFLDDIEERGLSEKILLVCCGEIGPHAADQRPGWS
ncbi:hypothetical protein Mal4_10670 [Maioricimonas rarisocia]|uniref:Uncharacterized protein n=1 Tax=Maioricimonas rarisocia TaxID=2528026 RepID=A0A517Z2S3_9PLAN|nr:DUF1501 domain-containing protein [Maioricimonas rarisocia]QDU36769.1 hypothetical protein Mal4_10670 [Maioricimonas rarisocia]